MTHATIDQLTLAAANASEPGLTPPSKVLLGGVDPLGMRQINFDLMDEVFPGINNVARHVRPFTVVTWAWRRAAQLAEEYGTEVQSGDLIDFVDRIEVLFVISQLLKDADADLPGKQFLAAWARERRFEFDGAAWQQRRKRRRYSTALSAPINYGPALKMLGWLAPHPDYRGVMLPTDIVQPALDALEGRIHNILGHNAFTKFGRVVVQRHEVERWAERWALDKPTATEARVMASVLFGMEAQQTRKEAGVLLLRAIKYVRGDTADDVRAAMAGAPSNLRVSPSLTDVQGRWRKLQIRQLFRFSLEALLYWTMIQIQDAAASTGALIRRFVEQLSTSPGARDASQWLRSFSRDDRGPVELIIELRDALGSESSGLLPDHIASGIAYSLKHAPSASPNEAGDRLPLARARKEADAWSQSNVREFLRNVLESWVLAQHEYWSVGRALADARVGARVLLRLKVILEEGGWALAPGVVVGNPPEPTRDRLQTAITLARECRLMTNAL